MDYRFKVVRSKLTVNAIQFASFTEAGCHSSSDIKLEQPFTGMAQRQRAGLITPRSQDRNLLPVSNHTSHRCIKALEQHFTGMAQARRFTLWSPNPEELDQHQSPVFYNIFTCV